MPIDRTQKAALDLNLVNGVTSDAPKIKANNDILYNFADSLEGSQNSHANAAVLPHADKSVIRAKLADKAVGPGQLDDFAVGPGHLQDNSVIGRMIPDNTIIRRHLADNAVGSAEIETGAVLSRHIANASLSADKFIPGALQNETQNGLEITAIKTETVYVVATGNADLDTANIQAAFNNYRNVTFSSNGDGKFLINSTITINPITIDFGLRGRTIDFNNCEITAVDKNGVTPDYLFLFTSGAWPSNLRNTKVRNAQFRGTVNKAFMKVQAGAMWGCSFEDIGSYTGTYAESVIEFNSHIVGSNGGLNTVRRIYSSSTHIKYALHFTVETGADSHFDDFTIEQITSNYTDGNGGATIQLNTDAYLVYSNIKVVYQGGKGHVISGVGNTFLFDCIVDNLYAEPKSPTAIGINVSAIRCSFRNFHLKYDPLVTTYARGYYGTAQECSFSSFVQTNNEGVKQASLYIETFTGDGNIFDRVGDGSITYIKIDASSFNNKVADKYGDPFIYAYGSTLKTYNGGATATNDTLLTLYQKDVQNNAILRCKLRGNTTANANNQFSIRLIGTGIPTQTLLTYAVATASQWEVDIDIVRLNGTQFMYFSKSFIDGVLQTAKHDGTPDKTALVVPTDLKIVINVTNSSLIYVMDVDCMRAKYVEKPV